MSKYEEKISDDSVWVTATPTPVTLHMPFYVTEAGHFLAKNGYGIKRAFHDSFLLIYTESGKGTVKTKNTQISLSPESCVIIDCREPHEYSVYSDEWDFFWIHFNGSAVKPLFDILYSEEVKSVNVYHHNEFVQFLSNIISSVQKNDIISSSEISVHIHSIFNTLLKSIMKNEYNQMSRSSPDITAAINFIKNNYSSPITIDDMICNIHVSKYHFIRTFRRVTGITPYSYLTNYRINVSKTLLRSTDKSVGEIAEECGFSDTSNFIVQFKKQTGQKPLQYRHDFS